MDSSSARDDHREKGSSLNRAHTHRINPQAIHMDYWGSEAAYSICTCRTKNIVSSKSLRITPRSCTKARGLLSDTWEHGIQSRPITSIQPIYRANPRGGVDDQVPTEQICEAERPTKSPPSKPTRRSDRPSPHRATRRGGGPSLVLLTHVIYDMTHHHQVTFGHTCNIPKECREVTVNMTA
jgi:hypothetical protein